MDITLNIGSKYCTRGSARSARNRSYWNRNKCKQPFSHVYLLHDAPVLSQKPFSLRNINWAMSGPYGLWVWCNHRENLSSWPRSCELQGLSPVHYITACIPATPILIFSAIVGFHTVQKSSCGTLSEVTNHKHYAELSLLRLMSSWIRFWMGIAFAWYSWNQTDVQSKSPHNHTTNNLELSKESD